MCIRYTFPLVSVQLHEIFPEAVIVQCLAMQYLVLPEHPLRYLSDSSLSNPLSAKNWRAERSGGRGTAAVPSFACG
jgi:hypothetical protein